MSVCWNLTRLSVCFQVSNVERAVERLEIRLGVMEQNPTQFSMYVDDHWGHSPAPFLSFYCFDEQHNIHA